MIYWNDENICKAANRDPKDNVAQVFLPQLVNVKKSMISLQKEADLDMIDSSIGHLMKTIGIKGASLALVKDEKLIFAKGFGEMNDKGDPVGPHTLFRIAGVSKAITSATIMSMIGKGEFIVNFP